MFNLTLNAASTTSTDELLSKADSIRSSDPEQFRSILKELSEEDLEQNSQQKEYYLYLKSYSKAYSGDYEGSIEGYKSLIATSSNQELIFRARMSLVNVFGITRNYNDAFKHLQQLASELPKIKDKKIRELGILVIALTNISYQQYPLAQEYAEKLLSENPTGRNLCAAKQIQLEAMFHTGALSANNSNVEQAVKQCEEINELVVSNSIKILKARALLEDHNYEQALNYLNSNFEEVKKTNYSRLIAEFSILLARAQWEKGDKSDAEKFAQNVIALSDGADYIKPKVLAYELLHEIERSKGKYKLALEHYVNYSLSDKAQINEVMAQQLAYQIVEHQTEEKTQEIELLNKENQLLGLEKSLADKEAANNRLMIILLILSLAFIAFWAYKIKKNQIKLKKQFEVDLLTKVATRHHFYQVANKTIEYSSKTNQEIALIMFDMDKFKQINDEYGHLVGDWVLKTAMRVCRNCWRANDTAGRLGGEEFVIMLPGCDLAKAQQIAEHCRRKLESIDTTESGHQFSVSASFGVTTTNIAGYDLKQLIASADKAMYQAKAEGRNQVFASV